MNFFENIDSFQELLKLFGVPSLFKNEKVFLDIKKELIIDSIKKRSWWYRTIYYTDNNDYSLINDTFRDILNELYYNISGDCSNLVFGYVKNKSILNNANKHLNPIILVKLDIKDFFDSIDEDMIKNMLIANWAKEWIASLMSKFSTIDNKLITWVSFSPILSNLIFLPIDREINDLLVGRKLFIQYSRYADDLVFSSKQKITIADIEQFIDEIKVLLEKHGFQINDKKTRIITSKHVQYVTWLTVNDKIRPRIPKRIKRKFRLESYYIAKYWMDNHLKKSSWSMFYKKWQSYSGWEQRIYRIEGIGYKNSIKRMISKLKQK